MNRWIEIIKNNDFIGAKKYIKSGADINEENENGETVLASALRHKCDSDFITLLIENGAEIFDFDNEGVSIFDMAITYNNIEMVKYLIKKGIDVNTTKRRSGFTALMCASCYGRVEIVKLLLEEDANEDNVDVKGFKASDFARKMNKKSVLKLLKVDESKVHNRSTC